MLTCMLFLKLQSAFRCHGFADTSEKITTLQFQEVDFCVAVVKSQVPELLNIRNKRGETPFWILMTLPDVSSESVLDLVTKGADPNIRSYDTSSFPETTPLELALLRDEQSLCWMLLFLGADPQGLGETIETPRGAVRICQPGAAEALLAKKPDRPVTSLDELEMMAETLGLDYDYYFEKISVKSIPERQKKQITRGGNATTTTGSSGGTRSTSTSTRMSTSYTRGGTGSSVWTHNTYVHHYHHDDDDDHTGGTSSWGGGGGDSSTTGGDGGGGGWGSSSGGGGYSSYSGGCDSGWSSGGGGGGGSCSGGDGGGGGWDD